MNLVSIEAKTLPEAWFLCLKKCLESGYEYRISQGSHAGHLRKEFDFITIRVEYPMSKPIIPDTPLSVPSVSSMEYVESYFQDYIFSAAPPKDNETYTYGQFIFPQLNMVLERIRKEGHGTNQTYIRIGDDKSDASTDPPCLRGIDIRVRYGKLHFMVYFRSWDLWAGFPSNMAAFQMLKEFAAAYVDVEDGELIACSKGLHLYDYTWGYAKQVVYR